MKIQAGIFILCLIAVNVSAQVQINNYSWQSELVQFNESGKLTYKVDAGGNQIPDFSSAGYEGGGVELPAIAVVKTISSVPGDNTRNIQQAIDELGTLLSSTGSRGALLLKAGLYSISGSVYLSYSGLVLRGEGDGADPVNSTILFSTDSTKAKRTLLYVGNQEKPNKWQNCNNKQYEIAADYVPVGAKSIKLYSVEGLKPGDQIIIQHDDTELWLNALEGGVGESGADPWTLDDDLHINYNRYIVSVDSVHNTIGLDAPVFYGLNKELSPSFIYKLSPNNIIKQVGVENLRIESYYNSDKTTTHPKYGTYYSDEQHAWTGIKVISAESAWIKDVSVKGFSGSGIMLTYTTRSTVQSCKVIDPVSLIHGGRRYGFNTADCCQLVLFADCYARNSRHGFISNGTSTASGNVFLYCQSESAFASSEGHRKWSNGFLFDNYKELAYNGTTGYTLAFLNRGSYGTSHGWSMVTGVAWNCDLTAGDPDNGHLIIQQPPTGQNYAIGCKASKVDGKGPFKAPVGFIEGANIQGLIPESLYVAQLKDRNKLTGN